MRTICFLGFFALMILAISPNSAVAADNQLLVTEVHVVDDTNGTPLLLEVLGNNLCRNDVPGVAISSLPNAFSLTECSILGNQDLITATLNVVLGAGTYLLVVDGNNNSGNGKNTANFSASKVDEFEFTYTPDFVSVAGDADTVDGAHASELEESAEIDADVSTHSGIPSAHHAKTDSFTELGDSAADSQIPNNITIDYAAAAGNADTVDGAHASALEESAEIDADITAHAGDPGIHHTKTSSFAELGGTATDAQIPNDISIDYAASAGAAGSAVNADTVDGYHGNTLANHSGDVSGPYNNLQIGSGRVGSAEISNGSVGSSDINTSQVQRRVSDYCSTGYSIRRIHSNGTVDCEYDSNSTNTFIQVLFLSTTDHCTDAEGYATKYSGCTDYHGVWPFGGDVHHDYTYIGYTVD
jgi:hypothetical protein